MMIDQHVRTFAQNVAANTFIGGIAKQGGTGVDAPIDTPSKLASKLGINTSRITGFKINGDNVSCNIVGEYYLLPNRFLGAFTQLSEANSNITYFIDSDGLVNNYVTGGTVSGRALFMCPNIKEIVMNKAYSFHEAAIADLPNLSKLELNSLVRLGNQSIRNLPLLENLSLPMLRDMYGSNWFLRGMTSLKVLNAPLLNKGGNNFLEGSVSLEYCNIKMMKNALGSNSFLNIKTNCIIDANVAMKTINSDGSADSRLLYAKNTRNCVINFYDDNGNYISTL